MRRIHLLTFGLVTVLAFAALTTTFAGETVTDTLAEVLKVDPRWDSLPEHTPATVKRLLRRCLTRDVDRRLSHVSSARLDLLEALEGTEEGAPVSMEAQRLPAWQRVLPWSLVALLVVVAGLAVRQVSTGSETVRAPLTLVAPFPEGLQLPISQMGIMDLSPDGKYLAITRFWTSDVFEITADGDHLVVQLNGQTTVDARSDRHQSGPIALQYNGSGQVRFRNVKIKMLE